MSKNLIKILSLGIMALLIGIILSLFFLEYNPLYSYAKWRIGRFTKSVLLILLNNVVVIFLTLFGGVIFSLLEIKSYEQMPKRLYNFLDLLCFPLHKTFEIFDKKIKGLKNPMKSCYFIVVSFPLVILFINVLLFSNLMMYGILKYRINETTYIIQTALLAITEFFCIGISALIAYDFSQRNCNLFEENDVNGFRNVSLMYLKSPKNWTLFTSLSLILIIAAFFEYSIIK